MMSYVPVHVESKRVFGQRAQGSFTSQSRCIYCIVYIFPQNKIPQSEVDLAGFTPKGENRVVCSLLRVPVPFCH